MLEEKPTTESMESLFTDFTPPAYEEWVAATVASLKGKPFETLLSQTYEGITLQPLYRAGDVTGLPHLHSQPGEFPFVRGTRAAGYLQQPWLIAQEMAYGTPRQCNEALRQDFDRGQTAVNLITDRPTRTGLDPDQPGAEGVGRKGVSLATSADFAAALAGVDLAQTPLFIRSGTAVLPLAALLAAYVRENGGNAAALRGSLEADPLGELARRGALPLPLDKAYDEIASLLRWTKRHAPQLRVITVHGYPYAGAGGSAVQELGLVLGTAVAYSRELLSRGLDVDTAAGAMHFAFSIGSDFFMEVAKLRAARLLWARIVKTFGGAAAVQQMVLHGRSARYSQSLIDIHVNMLRGTTAAFAAAAGGVDSLHVAPFNEEAGPPDAFSRRIARNVQVMLQEESNLTKVIDPAGGAYFVEWLTDQVAQKAWNLLQQVEAQGGMLAALRSGYVQEQLAATAASRAQHLARRKEVLVGTNMYTNPGEALPVPDNIDYAALHRERADSVRSFRQERQLEDDPEFAHLVAAAQDGATLGQLTAALRKNYPATGTPTLPPVNQHRAAAPFEALRAAAAAAPERPRIFLANMGPLRQHKARADFTRGFFEVGGFEIAYPGGFDSPAAAAAAALDDGAGAVVICATDESYLEAVPPLVAAIKSVRPDMPVLLAGYPEEHVESFKKAGVDAFIYLGADCLALNRWLQDQLIN